MGSGAKVRVAVVGLGFGAEFVPLYQKHPDAECYAICQRDEAKLKKHPGLANKTGHIGFLGHDSVVEFRNVRIKDLAESK